MVKKSLPKNRQKPSAEPKLTLAASQGAGARGPIARLIHHTRRYAMPASVFITGAAVLIVEVVATRILSPYFGNTIFTVSSIISIILAALSVGYAVGGRLADKRPNAKLFYAIIFAGGISVLILHWISQHVLPNISQNLSYVSGPLVASSLLFFVPAALLGMLSPFAIKLQQMYTPSKGTGTIAGNMFFWSTVGSIVGSLSTGFVLIPHFGVAAIVTGVGWCLLALGAIPLLLLGGQRHWIGIVGILAFLAFSSWFSALSLSTVSSSHVVYRHDGVYEDITIFDTTLNDRPARVFQQDHSTSGAMYLDPAQSDEPVFPYTKYYQLYKLFKPDTKQALVIGGGAYTIPKALLHDLPNVNVDVSEIEPSLPKLAQQYFKVPDSPRLHTYTDDGRRLLAQSNKQYDMIFSDVYYSLYSIPSHFTSAEFYKLSRQRLSPNGIFVANIIGSLSRQQPSLLLSEIKTFKAAYPNSYFFATGSPGSTNLQNIVFVGYNSSQPVNLSHEKLAAYTEPTLRDLATHQIDTRRFDIPAQPTFTDNYTPVEYFMSPLLKELTNNQRTDGQAMMNLIKQQLSYGPRYPSASGHQKTQQLIKAESQAIVSGGQGSVASQRWVHQNQDGSKSELNNILLRLNPGNPRRIIIASHYDSKRVGYLDKQDPNIAPPGANNSASGVAVMLETARKLALSSEKPPIGIDFIFFDGEEGEEKLGSETAGWQPLGSQYFVKHLDDYYPQGLPQSGVVLDMVCDKNLQFKQEASSLKAADVYVQNFWRAGQRVSSPQVFNNQRSTTIYDDHTSLNSAGIPSFLVIDYDYPAFDTRNDTLDKCSASSLQTVSSSLIAYLQTVD